MFRGRFGDGGGLEFSPFTKEKLRRYMAANHGMPFDIVPLVPESRNQRGWFEGAVIPLIAFYQEGMDHRDWEDLRRIREWVRAEFNSEVVTVNGRQSRVPMSTKGKLNGGFLERVIAWIYENYDPPAEALSPEAYKRWRDTVFSEGGADNYLDYLIERRVL